MANPRDPTDPEAAASEYFGTRTEHVSACRAAAIRERHSFVITSHARPDGDAVGSSMALALALDILGKRSRVVLKDPVPSPYAAFPAMDRIERCDRIDGPADTAIVLECSDLTRPEVAGLEAYYVINVDHHEGNRMYGALNWFDASAAAERTAWSGTSGRYASSVAGSGSVPSSRRRRSAHARYWRMASARRP